MHKTTYIDFYYVEEQVIEYAYESRAWHGEEGGLHSGEFTLVKKDLLMSVELSVIDEFIKREVMGDWLDNSPNWNQELIINLQLLESFAESAIYLSSCNELCKCPKWIEDLEESHKEQIRYFLKWINSHFNSPRGLSIQRRNVYTKHAIS